MEFYIIASIIGLGYYLNNEKSDRKPLESKKTIMGTASPTVYDGGDKVNNILRGEFRASDQIFKDARDSYSSTRVFPGPPRPAFNKVDYADKDLPLVFRPEGECNVRGEFGVSGDNGRKIASISGEMVGEKKFVHNNMMPFFGGKVKQNVEEFANSHRLEEQTGNSILSSQRKKEVEHLFAPQANLTNPYGMSNLSGYMAERYVVSNIRNNEVPVEQIRVGPGINQGYTAEPSGGFQQARTRDFVMPKTVDELRVKTNPRIEYEGRVLAGQKGNERGQFGVMSKNRPETAFEHGPSRFFGGMSECTKPRAPENYVLPETHRQTTELTNHYGVAGPTSVHKEVVRPNFEETHRQPLHTETQYSRNIDAEGRWRENDYGRSSMHASDTNYSQQCNAAPAMNLSGPQAPTQQTQHPELRYTQKMDSINNPNQNGYIRGPNAPTVGTVDEMKTTLKETMVENEHSGYLKGENKPIVYDPNDVPKTTMKETTVEYEYVTPPQAGERGGYEISTMHAPNTMRQFTSDVEYTGTAKSANNQPMSYQDALNATYRSLREQTSTSHTPGAAGPNRIQSSDDLNITTHKIGPLQSAQLENRDRMPTPYIVSPPNMEMMGKVKDKMTVSNNAIGDRLDCHVLDSLDSNPYAMTIAKCM